MRRPAAPLAPVTGSANGTVARAIVQRLIDYDKATAAIGGLRWRSFAEEEIRNALDAAPVRRIVPPEATA